MADLDWSLTFVVMALNGGDGDHLSLGQAALECRESHPIRRSTATGWKVASEFMLAHDVSRDFDQAQSNFSLQFTEHRSLRPLHLALLRFTRSLFTR